MLRQDDPKAESVAKKWIVMKNREHYRIIYRYRGLVDRGGNVVEKDPLEILDWEELMVSPAHPVYR